MRHPASEPTSRPAPAAERGSAYLFALLALLVLTVIGLSLVVITQTEAQIGGAEKSASRVLFGADSGMRMQFIAHAGGGRLWDVELDSTPVGGGETLREVVSMGVFFPIHTAPCNICSVNLGSDRFWAINYVTNALAERVTTTESTASKLLSQMFYKQPEQERRIDLSVRLFDATVTEDDPDTPGLQSTPKY